MSPGELGFRRDRSHAPKRYRTLSERDRADSPTGGQSQVAKRIRLGSEAYEVVRPVCIYVIAIAIVACVMALVGWDGSALGLGLLIAVIAATTVFQVRRAVMDLKGQSRNARRAAAEAERHYVEVLRRIIAYIEGRDRHWRGHSESVGDLAGRIARQMHLPEKTCAMLQLAGQLHDIGLLAIPEARAAGKRQFGAEDLRSVRRHSEVSYEVLKPLLMLAEILPAIRSHHERMNGTGYPAGLSGDEIPLGGRILGIADAYDAMTHDRPHRPAMSPLSAMRELRRCCPAGYDPACVEALEQVLNIPALEEASTVGRAACCAEPAVAL